MDKKRTDSSYAHILKYTGIFGGVQGLSLLVSLVRNKCIAVLLGPAGMGFIGLYNATVKMMADASGIGISTSAVRNVSIAFDSGSPSQLRHAVATIRSWSVTAALLGTLLCVLLSPLLSRATFSVGSYTLSFIALAPVVGLSTLVSGEMAVLKGVRRLGALAQITVVNVVGALLLSVPIFWLWGADGIVASLLAVALWQAVFTVGYSFRCCPWLPVPSWRSFKRLMREGGPMVRLGLAFVAASLFGSGSDYLIRVYLNHAGTVADVGLFNAGYLMTMTYGSMVFAAMETDYFPRLSVCSADVGRMNDTVNKQIEVSLVIISPMLVVFSVLLPTLLPLLFTDQFLPAVGMMQIVVVALYFRAVKLPISYLPLAKGDSRSFLLMEGIYGVAICLFVVAGYRLWGLTGTGLAILATAVFDFVMLSVYMHLHYGFCLSSRVMRLAAVEMSLALATYFSAKFTGWAFWLVGGSIVAVSLAYTFSIFRNKTDICRLISKTIERK